MQKGHPPKWADKFLEWYCKPELLEEIQGDALELFYKRIESLGIKAARCRYAWDVLRSFRLSTIRNFNVKLSPVMLRSNVKIAFRHLLKQKMYSAIKIGGFALGIAACLLIALFIRDELSYDQQYENRDRIYRVVKIYKGEGNALKGVYFPAPLAQTLKADYPEVELAGRINFNELFGAGSNEVRRSDETQNTYEDGFTFADQEFLDILEIPIIEGDPKRALAEPNTIVISKSKAEKYFPNEDPLGKTLILDEDEKQAFRIAGIMADFPPNLHVHFDFLITMAGREFWPGEQNFWRGNNYHTYIRLQPGTDVAALEKKMQDIFRKYVLPSRIEAGNVDAEKLTAQESLVLQPVPDIHLRSEGIQDRLSHGDIRFVWLFGSIAGFILLIACINFINLSTAKSARRAKEVGLRKVVGSYKGQLVNQFLTESTLYSIFSFIWGILLAWLLLPWFNQLADKSLVFPWREWWLLPVLLSSALATGLVAGLYPAFYLAGFKPIDVLKGQLSSGRKSVGMRNLLVVFQFTASIVLIIGTFIIYRQMNFILNKKVGFDKEQVVVIHGTNTLGEKLKTYKEALLQLPEVQSAAASNYLPVEGTGRNGGPFWKEGKTREDSPVYGQIWQVDHDYVKTIGMEIVAGRDFSVDMPTDSQAVIINQTLARELGMEDPLGKRITNGNFVGQVIGVVEDFHYDSMKEKIEAVCMAIGGGANMISVKAKGTEMNGLIESLTRVWTQFSPNQAIRYTFLDDDFAVMYDDVQRMGRIFTSFAILAIIVACLGLFALSAFMAEQRGKEMSIRKVLGASVGSLFRLMTQNFLLLVGIALVIAVPLGWYLMQKWLQDYEYRTPIGWDVFAIAGVIAILIALVTISSQALKAALNNPVEALNQE